MAIDDYDFKLSAGERASPAWRRIKAQIEFLVSEKGKRLEKQQPEVDTASLRGEIKSLRSILAFGTEPPPILDDGGEPGTRRARR